MCVLIDEVGLSVIGGPLEKSTCLGQRRPTHILGGVDQNRRLRWLRETVHIKVNVVEFVVNSNNIGGHTAPLNSES